ncbi:MAG: PEP-CTERM sorting domain-containing protein [Planctomycetes bacterium]|nr:PEP-CTERM sorting domain-containing protein [Planctomycetota bacterium]
MMRKTMAACVVALAAFATSAAAEPIEAFSSTITTGTTGNGKGRQTLKNFSLGLDFEVTHEFGLQISQLGVWDDNGNGLLSPHTISLYDLSNPGTPLAQISTLPGTGVLVDGYRYFDITPITLADGTLFTVVVYYPSGNLDSNGNSGPTPPSLGEPTPIFHGELDGHEFVSSVGVGRYGTGLAFPSTLDTGPSSRYHAGSFTYTPNPEPGTIVLLSGALAAAGAWRRRRAKLRK